MPKTMKLLFTMENKLWYYIESYGTLFYNGKNYGTIPKKLLNFHLLSKKLWCYTKQSIEVFKQLFIINKCNRWETPFVLLMKILYKKNPV